MFTVYTQFTNYPQAALIQTGRLWDGDPCATHWWIFGILY